MASNKIKDSDYLAGNPIVKRFIDEVNKEREIYYSTHFSNSKINPITIDVGRKFIRLWDGSSCWGFISRVDGIHKGAPIKKGDLLKPNSWRAPAKHARGNITDGTAKWGIYGPNYL
jgi:hypothetical protein